MEKIAVVVLAEENSSLAHMNVIWAASLAQGAQEQILACELQPWMYLLDVLSDSCLPFTELREKVMAVRASC